MHLAGTDHPAHQVIGMVRVHIRGDEVVGGGAP